MAQDGFENTREPSNYGSFINQFQSEIITSIRQGLIQIYDDKNAYNF